MIIVHHGFFKSDIPSPPRVTGVLRGRLKLLLHHDINLCGFHLPLDGHPQIGNNISLCRALGVENTKPLDVGFVGDLARAITLKTFVAKVEKVTGSDCRVIAGGPSTVRRVAVVSGGASSMHELVRDRGADVFVCGDTKENVVRAVEEEGLNLIDAGHYNTETAGVRNLAALLAKEFGIPAEFVDVPCDV
jgi:dinuclear metal center YbgI/SA1388 family protein